MNRFEKGDIVWAKLSGHPEWPAEVLEVYDKKDRIKVSYIGDDSYSELPRNKVYAWKDKEEKFIRPKKKLSKRRQEKLDRAMADARLKYGRRNGLLEEDQKALHERHCSPNSKSPMPENSKEGSNQLSTEPSNSSKEQIIRDETKEEIPRSSGKQNHTPANEKVEDALCGADATSAREVDEVATHSNTPGGGAAEGGIEFDSNSPEGERDPASKNSKEHTIQGKLEEAGSQKEPQKVSKTPIEENPTSQEERHKENEEAPLAPSEDLSLTRSKRRREERIEHQRKRQKTDFGEAKQEEELREESADSRKLSLTHSKSKSSAKKSTLLRRDSSKRISA